MSYRLTTALDASGSTDADGPMLEYHWATTSLPVGSTATLSDPTAEQPRFLADLPGAYTFSLTVDDTVLTSAPASVTITAIDDPPQPRMSGPSAAITGQLVTFDASSSSDPNDDPLTYAWTMTTRPPGSAATLSATTSPVTQFTPDVDGPYGVSLVVSDGRQTAGPVNGGVASYAAITPLPFEPTIAAYSPALDVIVFGATSPDMLYIYDPATGTTRTIAMPAPPKQLAVSQDGLQVAVAHVGRIGVYDLVHARLVTRWPVTDLNDPTQIVFPNNGYVYAFGRGGFTLPGAYCVHLSDGTVTHGTTAGYTGEKAAWRPGTTDLYVDSNLVPDAVYKESIATGVTTLTSVWSYSSQYTGCNALWFTDDGNDFFTGCGDMFTASTTNTADMQFVAALPGSPYLRALSQAKDKLLVTTQTDDTTFELYTFPGLVLSQTFEPPVYVASNTAYSGHPRYVFVTADGTKYRVVYQIDASAGLTNDFAVAGTAF